MSTDSVPRSPQVTPINYRGYTIRREKRGKKYLYYWQPPNCLTEMFTSLKAAKKRIDTLFVTGSVR